MTQSNKRRVSADNYFAMIPEWVLYAPITAKAKLTYAVLNRYANSDGMCYPSRKTIAARLTLSVKTVDRALSELEDLGAILVKRRMNDDGSYTSNLYRVITQRPVELRRFPGEQVVEEWDDLESPESLPGVFDDATGGVKSDSLIRAISNQSQRTRDISPATKVAGSEFDEFWDVYPRRIAKGNARKAWVKAIKTTEPLVIVEAARRFGASAHGADPKFVPHPATWLNGERWTDEPDPEFKQRGNRRDEFDAMFEEAARDVFGTDSLGYQRKELGS